MIPRYFRQASDLAAIQFGMTTESLVLDFKETIPNWRLPKGVRERERLAAEAQRETCRDIAQFANTDGGCLLIGVIERLAPGSHLKVAAGIRSVEDTDGIRQWIEQAIRNWLVPATFSRDIAIIQHAEGVVAAVNVLPSSRLVTLWDAPRLECVRRTSHGKDSMNPDEMERHIMNSSRAVRLGLEQAMTKVTASGVELAGGHWVRPPGHYGAPLRWKPDGNVTLGQIDENWFELRVPAGGRSHSVNLPFGILQEPWVGADGRLNLLLSMRVVFESGAFSIER